MISEFCLLSYRSYLPTKKKVHRKEMNDEWARVFTGLEPVWKFLHDRKNIRDKHISLLEATQKDHRDYFWNDLAKSNLLVLLYSCAIADNGQKLRKQNKSTLDKDVKNITALRVQEQILRSSMRDANNGQNIPMGSENSDESTVQEIIRKSEIAFAYSYVNPRFYPKAIEMYEQVMEHYEREANLKPVVEERLGGRLCSWYFYLAQAYCRMLNKGSSNLLFRSKSPTAVFQEISRRLKFVIDSTDKFYSGRAMIELVDAYKKCETAPRDDSDPEGNNIIFPYGNPDNFVLEALRVAPNDPYVLERCGRHYRQRASNEETFREAQNILLRAVELSPTRHFAWHHLGLVNRSLWLELGDYPEAKLHRNSARKGNKKSVRRRGKSSNSKSNNGGHQKIKDVSGPDAICSEADNCNSERHALELHRSFSSQISLKDKSFDPPGIPQTAPASLPTLRPKFHAKPGQTPKQSRMPDLYDKLRVSNPLIKSRDHPSTNYLLEAEKCLDEACRLSNYTSCCYFADYIRILISLGESQKAEEMFERAIDMLSEQSPATADHKDCAYLYEQRALFEHRKLVPTSSDYDESITCVMKWYRLAIREAVTAKVRSKMSFYKLRDILEERMDKNPLNDKAYRLEYNVLYDTMEKHSDSPEALVQALECEKTCQLALELIKLLYERSQENDASTAFVYITALKNAGKFDLDGSKHNREMVVNLVKRMNEERLDHTIASQVFRWLVGDKTMRERGFKTPQGNCWPGPYDACILAESGESPLVDHIRKLLRDEMHLEVGRAFCDTRDEDEVYEGHFPLYGMFELVSESKSVFIVEDESGKLPDKLVALFNGISTELPTSTVCVVGTLSTDSSPAEYRHFQTWPRYAIKNDADIKSAVCELLQKVSETPMQ
jgi:tetratricopeptide (TPR) repeat protein